MVKKILIGVGIFLIVVFIVLATAPLIFKDQIKQAVDEQLEANVNAEVLYDIDNFSLSFFANFPNLTTGISDLAVVGREPFAGKVLFAVEEFQIELNIWKLISSEMSVEGIYLNQPEIFIKVLEDGTANYDIAVGSEEEEVTDESDEPADFTLAIEQWRITGGHIIYDDATLPTNLEFNNFNHSGSGNFSLSVFDLKTTTEAYIAQLSYDGDGYLEHRNVKLDLVLNMDLDQMRFTFKENNLAINDFSFGFDGWVEMPDDDINMDLTFTSQDNSFKSLISLIPAIYTQEFSDLETSGSLTFDGAVQGTYNETSIPAYDINLAVNDGMFHYPTLPESVNNVQLMMNINSKDGNIDYTAIDISKFHLEFGQEPMDGYFRLGNLLTYPIDLDFKTTINLENMSGMLPMEGLELQGVVQANLKAVGEYDSLRATIPLITAAINLRDGVIRYADLPAPLENFNMSASLINETGKLNDTRFAIPEISLELDGNQMSGELLVDNFDNMHWQAVLLGEFDFDKLFPIINHLYPLPGTSMAGKIKSSLTSEGRMQDVELKNYAAINTSGETAFERFTYTDSLSLPQGLEIISGSITFDPKQIKVTNLETKVGTSDFSFSGKINNYLSYILKNGLLNGELSMQSNLVDVNEFMLDSDEEVSEDNSEPYTVIEVPANIDFIFNADLGRIKYDNLLLEDARGKILIRNGELRLDNLFTRTLGGTITFDGVYNTKDLGKPKFAMELDAKTIQIGEAYQAFSMIQALAPVARDVSGEASSLFSINGVLQDDMMPDMQTLNGQGKINIVDASLKNSNFASGVTSFFKGGENQSLTLKDILMRVTISDGRLLVEPFDMQLNNTKANISGMSGLDGSLDYIIKMAVPAGQLGAQANSLIGSLTGNESSGETLNLNIGVGGSYDDPKFNLLGTDAQSAAKQVATEKAADLIKENTGVEVPVTKEALQEEAMAKARDEADKLLAEAQKQADQVKLEAKKAADKIRQEAEVQRDKLMKEAGDNIFKKKGAEIAGKKLTDEAEVQAARIEAEGDNQAESIMAKAKARADTLLNNANNQ